MVGFLEGPAQEIEGDGLMRWHGKTAWQVDALKKNGGSMIVPSETQARGIAARWGGVARFAPRRGAASTLNPDPPGTWFVDFEARTPKEQS